MAGSSVAVACLGVFDRVGPLLNLDIAGFGILWGGRLQSIQLDELDRGMELDRSAE